MKVNNRVLILREAITRIIPMLTQRSVKVTQQGTQAYVSYNRRTLEIERVNLPYIPDDADDTLLDATQGFLDHEVGHILFTDQKIVLKAEKQHVHSLHNMIEDTFVERRMGEQFPGCGANLSKMHGFFLTEYIDAQLKEKPEHAAAILMVVAIRAWAGQPAFVDYMSDKWELMKDVTDRLGKDFPGMVRNVKSSQDGLAVALEAKKRLEPKKPPVPAPPPPPAPPEPPSAPESSGEPGDPEDDEEAEASSTSGDAPPEDEDGDMPTPGDMPELGDSPEPPQPSGEEIREPVSEPEEEEGDEPAPAGADEDPVGDEPADEDDEAEDDEPADEPEAPTGAGQGGTSSDDDSEDDGSGDEPGDGMPGGDAASGEEDQDGNASGTEPGDDAEDGDGGSGSGTQPGDGNPQEGTGEPDGDPERDLFQEIADAPVKEFDEAAAEALSKRVLSATADSEYTIFTRDEDSIYTLEPPDGFEQSLVTDMQTQVDHMIGPLQKDLQRAISARSASVWTGGHKRGRLHGASLARVLTGRDDVFRQKQINKAKDVAVELVVDMSGSMFSYGKIRVAAYTAYALASVLDSLSIPNEVIGFTTKDFSANTKRAMAEEYDKHGLRYSRTDALVMPIIKGFGERVTPEVRRRFALMANDTSLMNENIDGECVQIAHRRLMMQRSTRKVLMVLSDGKPACGGLSATLNSHLKEVVRQIERLGTDVVALGIIDDSVKEFYRNAIVMKKVEELPTLVMRELHRLLVQ